MDNLEKEFFDFIYERQLIWYKRFVLHNNPPWTNDKILRTYKIINVYRELDKCTIYIINKLKNIKDRNKLFLNIVFYRFFNQINLYEKIKTDPFDKLDENLKNKIVYKFDRIKSNGHPIFNNAYLISSGIKGKKKHISILDNLSCLNVEKLVKEIDLCNDPEKALQIIQEIPMVGPFLACEIWTDLSYFHFFKQGWTDNDFVNLGPGAKWGIEIMYNKKFKKEVLNEMLKHLWQIQPNFLKGKIKRSEKFKWEDIAFKEAYSNYPYLSITNIEGALCEFRKYCNIKNGKGRRKYFIPLNYDK